jgi:hypothetical protein
MLRKKKEKEKEREKRGERVEGNIKLHCIESDRYDMLT